MEQTSQDKVKGKPAGAAEDGMIKIAPISQHGGAGLRRQRITGAAPAATSPCPSGRCHPRPHCAGERTEAQRLWASHPRSRSREPRRGLHTQPLRPLTTKASCTVAPQLPFPARGRGSLHGAQRAELPSGVRTWAPGGPGLTAVSRCLGLPNGVRTVLCADS